MDIINIINGINKSDALKISHYETAIVEGEVLVLKKVTFSMNGISCVKADVLYVHAKAMKTKRPSKAKQLEARIKVLEDTVSTLKSATTLYGSGVQPSVFGTSSK